MFNPGDLCEIIKSALPNSPNIGKKVTVIGTANYDPTGFTNLNFQSSVHPVYGEMIEVEGQGLRCYKPRSPQDEDNTDQPPELIETNVIHVPVAWLRKLEPDQPAVKELESAVD